MKGNLKEEIRGIVDAKTKEMEEEATSEGLQDKFLAILAHLESKYVK